MTNRPRVKFSELIYASVALAFLVGASLVFTHHALDAEHMLGAALLIMALAYFILKPKPVRRLKTPVWVPEAPEGSIPRYASRRWARAIYHNGMCDIEELNAFMAAHPARDDDPDR